MNLADGPHTHPCDRCRTPVTCEAERMQLTMGDAWPTWMCPAWQDFREQHKAWLCATCTTAQATTRARWSNRLP